MAIQIASYVHKTYNLIKHLELPLPKRPIQSGYYPILDYFFQRALIPCYLVFLNIL